MPAGSAPTPIMDAMSGRVTSPRIVGREAELDALGSALERASRAEPAAVFLGGDSGIGKSRLLHEFEQRAAAAGAGLLAVRTLLGLRPDSDHRGIIAHPCLPDDWDRFDVAGLNVFGRSFDLAVERTSHGYSTMISADVAAIL